MTTTVATLEDLTIYLYGLEKHGTPYIADSIKVYVSLPERIPFEIRDDSITHVCTGKERVFDLAIRYYRGLYKNPIDHWRTIAQFQEDPIIDPSIPLRSGRIITIPSPAFNDDVAYGDSLTDYPQT